MVGCNLNRLFGVFPPRTSLSRPANREALDFGRSVSASMGFAMVPWVNYPQTFSPFQRGGRAVGLCFRCEAVTFSAFLVP